MTTADYGVWRSLNYRPVIAEHLPDSVLQFLSPGQAALEIGCGKGSVCLFLARYGIRVLGIDLNAAAVEEANQRAVRESLDPLASFEVKDFLEKPPQETFDLVLLIRILTCYPAPSAWEALLQQAHLRLKVGGLLYVHDFMMAPEIEQYRARYESGVSKGWCPGSFAVNDEDGKLLFVAHHHSQEELAMITGPYETVTLTFHRSLSMNGNECKMFEFIGRKP